MFGGRGGTQGHPHMAIPQAASWRDPSSTGIRVESPPWRSAAYGMRTRYTLSGSDETWYRQNIITGVALVAGGVVWLVVLALGP